MHDPPFRRSERHRGDSLAAGRQRRARRRPRASSRSRALARRGGRRTRSRTRTSFPLRAVDHSRQQVLEVVRKPGRALARRPRRRRPSELDLQRLRVGTDLAARASSPRGASVRASIRRRALASSGASQASSAGTGLARVAARRARIARSLRRHRTDLGVAAALPAALASRARRSPAAATPAARTGSGRGRRPARELRRRDDRRLSMIAGADAPAGRSAATRPAPRDRPRSPPRAAGARKPCRLSRSR